MLFRCLIVDDETGKAKRVREVIENEVGISETSISHARSASEATVFLRSHDFDLVVVDLNLPMRTDETAATDGGIRLLRQIARGTNSLRRPMAIVGLTAFADLAVVSTPSFQEHGWALVTYSAESSNWETSLVNQCQHICSSKRRILAEGAGAKYDVCILTALSETELEAVLRLPYDWATKNFERDDTRYEVGSINVEGRRISVLACACPEMGNSAAAVMASKMVLKFRPKVVVLCGICAGIAARIGDIAIAEFSLHHDAGKWTEGDGGETVFLPQPRYREAGTGVLEAIRRYALQNKASILALPSTWQGNRPQTAPEVHIGPVASGAAVVENKEIVRELKFRDRKLIGLEMESYGFYLGVAKSASSSSQCIMIKGVCDTASPPKTDEYQKYAAFLSAEFLDGFLRVEMSVAGGLLNS